jgi:hypothetical protein
MSPRTVLSTDWIEVHDHDSVCMARVFLTDEDEAYMIRKSQNETKFFKVNPELLKLGELGFFEKVIESAEEIPVEQAYEFGFV